MKLIDLNTVVLVYFMEDEQWADVSYPGIDGSKYMISNYGNVKNKKSGKILKPFPDGKGNYLYISFASIDDKKRRKNVSIHRLVAWHFVEGFTDEKNEVNHRDNNTFNNYFENLVWATRTENNEYIIEQGRHYTNLMKDNNPCIKYTKKIVIKVKELLELNHSVPEIADHILHNYKKKKFKRKQLMDFIRQVKSGYRRSNITGY